jgi:AcrR family transcriptional regulator
VRQNRPELSKKVVALYKRRRMVDAVAELSAERGYEAMKIADVVRRAGVARKTLYDNFEGKEDLFLAAVDATFTEARVRVAEACEGVEGVWQKRVEYGLGAFLEFVAERPAAARMCLIETISATPAAASRYDTALRSYAELLHRAPPPESELPMTIEESLVGGVAWVVSQQIRRGATEEVAELLPELSEFVLSPYHGVAKI